MQMNEHTEAIVFNIAHCSLHDGDGIRTVVYLKGCNLRCPWCHNPESISPQPQILYRESRCIGCGRCVSHCPEHHRIVDGKMVYSRVNCASCMPAVADCPNDALTLCGKTMTEQDTMREILKDKPYYDASGGGMTLSGGECLLQADFSAALLDSCRKAGVHTAVESAFYLPWDVIERIHPLTDAFLIDIKHADSTLHRRLTGVPNGLILDNIRRLSCSHPNITIRVPLIPGVNDDENNLQETAALIRSFGGGVRRLELLPYNSMAGSKYTALGKEAALIAGQSQDQAMMLQICEMMAGATAGKVEVICN